MSRSNPTLTNLAAHFFEWKGGEGKLQWYNKETEQNVPVKLPFEFMVLDELATIKGYNKAMQQGFWSNEVRNISKDTIYVRTKNGPFEAGIYNNLTQTRSKGGKYAKSIYIAHKGEGGAWMIGNIQATGSALSAWIEFSKTHAVETGKITMKRGAKAESPVGEFYPPEFSWSKITDEEDAEAVKLDKELQIYLSQYLAQPKGDEDQLELAEDFHEVGKATPEQVAEFEKRKASHSRSAKQESEPLPTEPDEVIDDIGDEPINLNDIPF
jgi:hypothetical protein